MQVEPLVLQGIPDSTQVASFHVAFKPVTQKERGPGVSPYLDYELVICFSHVSLLLFLQTKTLSQLQDKEIIILSCIRLFHGAVTMARGLV